MSRVKSYIPIEFPPKDLRLEPFIKNIGEAHRGIALFDGILRALPNPDILLAPLATNEAVLSSKIEGTQTTFEDVLKEEAGITPKNISQSLREDLKEVLNYKKALIYGSQAIEYRDLTLSLIKELQKILLTDVRGKYRLLGEFRKSQNWIGSPGSSMENARYVPPDPIILPEHLEYWEKFLKSDDYPDKIVQLGLLHAQFEILHPFEDGNGRVGRLIIPLFLYWKSLISRPSFYLSEYLEKNRTEYYDRLLMITKDNNWSGWIDFFLTAVIQQAKINIDKAQKLLNLYNEMKDGFIQATKSQYAIPALDAFFRQPIITTTKFKEAIGAPKKSSSNEILKILEKSGLIKLYEMAEGNKPAKYAFIKILEIVGEAEI
ncbi:filamentation induced by cAMP protein Fic [Hydrogenobaculum sp. Y04AAS1]|uniref:Fic/DOC family N-terminal domain-containing protein n=1 Tax=Hydrogenobaculum sp. (strain Y04AAS1) TaxID=380749 RepID=UPI00015BD5B9|nr:filamentation induced by cAMP protein Fic [Hydrogenobaculum sp. Y04AAS1]HCT67023.1 Fic family protein [Hydrogenobaculum sp.]